MKFYAENKINPFASCLPLLAQMPFFIGLFYLLQSDLRSDICGPAVKTVAKTVPCAQIDGAYPGSPEQFLFIPDLTVKATGWVLAVLIVMYIVSQLLSSVLTPSTADRNQRMIMYGLPFVFVFFIFTFPAGLIVYWITTNLWTVGQGYVLRRRLGPVSLPKGDAVAVPAGAGASAAPSGGGFMARMAAMTGSAAEKKKAEEAEKPAARTGSSKPAPAKTKTRTPATASATTGKSRGRAKSAEPAAEPAAKPARSGPPPPPPRKKKKRSGRRR
jgi:YidC/Oxa1 family membrane protein insertase